MGHLHAQVRYYVLGAEYDTALLAKVSPLPVLTAYSADQRFTLLAWLPKGDSSTLSDRLFAATWLVPQLRQMPTLVGPLGVSYIQ